VKLYYLWMFLKRIQKKKQVSEKKEQTCKMSYYNLNIPTLLYKYDPMHYNQDLSFLHMKTFQDYRKYGHNNQTYFGSTLCSSLHVPAKKSYETPLEKFSLEPTKYVIYGGGICSEYRANPDYQAPIKVTKKSKENESDDESDDEENQDDEEDENNPKEILQIKEHYTVGTFFGHILARKKLMEQADINNYPDLFSVENNQFSMNVLKYFEITIIHNKDRSKDRIVTENYRNFCGEFKDLIYYGKGKTGYIKFKLSYNLPQENEIY